jgi:hypothetical protein
MLSNMGVPRVIKNYKFPAGKKSSVKLRGTKYREGTPETQTKMARRTRDKT